MDGEKKTIRSFLGHVLRFSISVVPIFHRKIHEKSPSIFKIRNLRCLISRSSFYEIKGIPREDREWSPKSVGKGSEGKTSSSQSSKDLTFLLGCENIIYLYKHSCKTHWKIAMKINGKTSVVQAWFFFSGEESGGHLWTSKWKPCQWWGQASGTNLSWIGGLHHLRNIWGPLCTICACLKSLLDWNMQLWSQFWRQSQQ